MQTSTETPGAVVRTLQVGGVARSFVLHVPAQQPTDSTGALQPFPLMLVLHGSGASGEAIRRESRLDSIADAQHFIVVYPNGSTGPFLSGEPDWNAGVCCGMASQTHVDDVGFLSAVIDNVSSTLPVDARRVSIAGFSDGGRMAYHAACLLADRIAAIAVVSGSLVDPNCDPTRAVPVIAFHGTADDQVAYDEPALTTPVADSTMPSVAQDAPPALQFWVAQNDCQRATQVATATDVERYSFNKCNGAPVVLFRINNGVHTWPGGTDVDPKSPDSEINASALLVRFVLARRLPVPVTSSSAISR